MKREILINGSQRETRVAILEDDRLVELLVDRPDHRRTVGDIYLGRVEAVLPGIQAAFVDIGQEKSAFLHASDLLEPDEDEDPVEEAEEEAAEAEARRGSAEAAAAEERARPSGKAAGGAGIGAAGAGRQRRHDGRDRRAAVTSGEARQREISPRRALPNIQDILKKGQTLPVQVTKEPISTKGCRVTAQISLPGRFLVYMPYASKVGVSRKIESREQRSKLREMVTKLLPKDAGGVIVRTVGRRGDRGALPPRDRLAAGALEEDQPQEDLRPSGAGAAAAGDQPHPRHHPRPLQRQGRRAPRRLEASCTTRSSSTSSRSIPS